MAIESKDTSTATTLGLSKYVHVMYFVGTVVVGWLLVQITETVWTSLNLSVTAVPPPNKALTVVIGGAGAVSLAVYLWRHPKVNNLAMEIVVELSKVTWPTRNETWVTTIAVLIMVTLAAIFFMLSDQLLGWIVSLILGIGR